LKLLLLLIATLLSIYTKTRKGFLPAESYRQIAGMERYQ